MGYSLGDFNLNRIFNEAQVNKAVSLRKSDIFLVNRDFVDEIFQIFYSFSYGIQVIQLTEIDDLLSGIDNKNDDAIKLVSEADNLLNVMNGTHIYLDDYIKHRTSFSNILLQASTLNIDPRDRKLIKVLIDVLKKKKTFTEEHGAWSQYGHFAEWLIDLGSLIDIKDNNIEDDYFELVNYSFRTMSREQIWGYSWAAYGIWKSRFQELKLENQNIFKSHIKKNFKEGDPAYYLI